MGLRSQCIFKLVTFVSSSCLQLQLQSTPSTSPRRISSGSSRRLSRTRRAIPTLRCTIVFSRCLLFELDLVLVDLVGGTRKRLLVGVVVVVLSQEQGQEQAARQKMFDSMDLKSTGVITFDEWLKFCREHIAAKTATMDPHPIIDQGSVEEYKKFVETAINNSSSAEALELYWYMLEIFTEHDLEKTGFIKLETFPSMMHEFLATPVKHGLTTP